MGLCDFFKLNYVVIFVSVYCATIPESGVHYPE